MKKVSVLYIGLLFFTTACQSFKDQGQTVSAVVRVVKLSDEDQRKFDFFFYEANKEKMLGNVEKAATYYGECLRIDPNSGACMYELANLYLISKQIAKSQMLLERAIQLNPENDWYKLFLGDLYQQTEAYDKAIEIYEDLSKKWPQNEEYCYMLAQLYGHQKKYAQALNYYEKIEDLIGINEIISLEKESMYVTMGERKLAFSEINKLIKRFPNVAKYYGLKGDLYFYYKEYDKAEFNYRYVLSMDSTYSMIYFQLANVFGVRNDTTGFIREFGQGMVSKYVNVDTKIQKILPFLISDSKSKEFVKAESLHTFLLRLIQDYPFESKTYILYGNFLKNSGSKQDALKYYRLGAELDLGNEALWNDILLLEIELNEIKTLISDGKRATEIHSENGFFYLLLASGLSQNNQYAEALEEVSKGLGFIGGNTALEGQFYALAGDLNYKIGKVKESFDSYERALQINDKNLMVLNNYSYFLALENQDLDKAEQMSSKCIDLEPGNDTYLDTYAWVLFKRKRYLEAKFVIERAIDNGGDTNSEILEHYGDILFFTGDTENAVTNWKKALELGSESNVLEEKINSRSYIESK